MTQSEHQPSPPGSISWNELHTNDPEGSKKFYRELLGWESYEMPIADSNYTIFKHAGKDRAGMMKIEPSWGEVPPQWMTYMIVEDVDAAAAKVTELGGQIGCPPSDIPDIGRFAIVTDPQGATFALFADAVK